MLGHYLHASKTPFRWRFAGRPKMARLYWHLDPPSLINLKKQKQTKKTAKLDPHLQNILDLRMHAKRWLDPDGLLVTYVDTSGISADYFHTSEVDCLSARKYTGWQLKDSHFPRGFSFQFFFNALLNFYRTSSENGIDHLTLSLHCLRRLFLSADGLWKQFGPRSEGPIEHHNVWLDNIRNLSEVH